MSAGATSGTKTPSRVPGNASKRKFVTATVQILFEAWQKHYTNLRGTTRAK